MKQGDHVRVYVPQGDWRHIYDGNTGIVACTHSDGLTYVDMLDGPDKGWVVAFRPNQIWL